MTQEEINIFIQEENIILESTNSKFSFKTNLYIIKRNFDKIRIRLMMLHKYITYVYGLVNVENITENVLDNIAVNKLNLSINNDLLENTSVIEKGYSIKRLPGNLVQITKQLNTNEWIVDNLLVSVKNVEGQLIYPSIITRNNTIEIYFLDGISSNYKVFII